MIPRYYAKWIEESVRWGVFDRQQPLTYKYPDPLPVCVCDLRRDAFRIRDLLNADEDSAS